MDRRVVEGLEEDDDEEEVIDPTTLQPLLYEAAARNDTNAVIDFLLQQVPPIHVDISSGFTPLHWASMNGNLHLVRKLLEHGASEPYHNYRAKQEREATLASTRDIKRTREFVGEGTAADDDVYGTEDTTEAAAKTDGNSAMEVTVDYLTDTPLLWAAHGGHLPVLWELVMDGYSPNDTDKVGNNALHLAAAFGDERIVAVMIADGGNANAVNRYKNLPRDMARTRAIRDMLTVAMSEGASWTEADRQLRHETNVLKYKRMTDALAGAITEVSNALKQDDNIVTTTKQYNHLLTESITLGKENSLDMEMICEAEHLLRRIEATQDLVNSSMKLQSVLPLTDQRSYLHHIDALEVSLENALSSNVDQQHIQVALDLISRAQTEYWLGVLLHRVRDIVNANDKNEHDMNKLRDAIQKARVAGADEDLVKRGAAFLARLDVELGMNRALRRLPVVKPMPPADQPPPVGYWLESEVGRVQETEGYPLPPADGEYVWIPSDVYLGYTEAIGTLRSYIVDAEALGVNAALVAEVNEKLSKVDKDMKILDMKDAADKIAAIEAVKKLAKKLKGKKKKKPAAK